MLWLSLSGKNLALKIIKDNNYDRDKYLLKTIQEKYPIYGLEGGVDVFKYFEVPKEYIGHIIKCWGKDNIQADSPEIKEYLGRYDKLYVKLNNLPKINDEINYPYEPRPYQDDYIRINKDKNKLIAAMAIGAGKSLSSLIRAKVLQKNQHFKLLIVCPKNCLRNWQTEIRKVYGLPSTRYHADKNKREKLKETLSGENIIVTTYEMVSELDFYNADEIIIDEAHLIKNPSTKRYRGVKKVLDNNQKAGLQLLTGTPIYSKIEDLHTLLKLTVPELAGSRGFFKSRYQSVVAYKEINSKKLRRKIKIPIIFENRNEGELQEKLQTIMFRVNEDEVRTYADNIEFITVDMTNKQQKFYREIALEFLNRNPDEKNFLTEIIRLQQASEGLYNFLPGTRESGKLDFVDEQIDNLYEDEKIIIWSRYKPGTEILYEKYKDKAVIFNGSVPNTRKILGIWAFQGVETIEDEREYERLLEYNKDFNLLPGEAQVFIGTIDERASIGINLQKASKQIVVTPHLAYNTNQQALGRIRRIGQEAAEVNTIFLNSYGTIDLSTLNNIFSNAKQNIRVIDGSHSLTYSQIRELTEELRELIK